MLKNVRFKQPHMAIEKADKNTVKEDDNIEIKILGLQMRH